MQVPLLVRRGMKFTFGVSFSHPGIKNVARFMIPRLFGIGIGQINLVRGYAIRDGTHYACRESWQRLTVADRRWSWSSGDTQLPWPPPFCR